VAHPQRQTCQFHSTQAYGYGNEEAVGRAMRDSGVPREDIFLTTKLTYVLGADVSDTPYCYLIALLLSFSGKHHGSVAEGFETSLKALNVDYIDLYVSGLRPVSPGCPLNNSVPSSPSLSTGLKLSTRKPRNQSRTAKLLRLSTLGRAWRSCSKTRTSDVERSGGKRRRQWPFHRS
jgi:hypothetical protein